MHSVNELGGIGVCRASFLYQYAHDRFGIPPE